VKLAAPQQSEILLAALFKSVVVAKYALTLGTALVLEHRSYTLMQQIP
jgi:hypothetical protein